MRNRFKGFCYRCGGVVEAGDGHYQLNQKQSENKRFWGIKWLTQHAECAIQYRETDVSVWPILALINKTKAIKVGGNK
jgi:hypothetical protein